MNVRTPPVAGSLMGEEHWIGALLYSTDAARPAEDALQLSAAVQAARNAAQVYPEA